MQFKNNTNVFKKHMSESHGNVTILLKIIKRKKLNQFMDVKTQAILIHS